MWDINRQYPYASAINPGVVYNPTYKAYVSQRVLDEGKFMTKFERADLTNNRKTIFFSYYDSTVANSHLNPHDITTFIKPYTPPAKPSKDKLLNNYAKKVSKIPGQRITPRVQ